MRYSTITAIGTFSSVNDATGDTLLLVPSACSGGEAATLRTVVENAPGADGVLVFPPLEGGQIITLTGDVTIRSTGAEAAYFTAIDTLVSSLKTALDAMRTAAASLAYGSSSTLSCWYYAPLESAWLDDQLTKRLTFGLVVDTS